MAGAHALGEFVSLDDGGELRDRVLAARALQARAGAAARRAAGQGRARHRRRRRHRPRDRRVARLRGRVRRRVRPRRRRAPRTRSRNYGDGGAGGRRRRHQRGGRARRRSPRPSRRYGGVDIVVSNAGVASSAAIEETTLAEWDRNHAILGTGYFLVAREAFRVLERRTPAARSSSSPPRTRWSPARTPRRTRRPRPPSCTSRAASPRRAAPTGIRVNTVNPDAVLQGSRIWDSSWREERAAAYSLEPDELEEHYRKRTTLKVNIFPEDIAEAVLHFASDRALGQEHRQHAQRRRRRARGLPALTVSLRRRPRRCGRPPRCGRRRGRSAGSRPPARHRAARRRGSSRWRPSPGAAGE